MTADDMNRALCHGLGVAADRCLALTITLEPGSYPRVDVTYVASPVEDGRWGELTELVSTYELRPRDDA